MTAGTTGRVLRAGLAAAGLWIWPAAAQPLLVEIAGATGSEQGQTRAVTAHGDWTVACEGASCRMFLHASADTAGRQVAVELAGERVPGGDPLFLLRTPLDLLVAQGAELRFAGTQPLRLAYRSCHSSGCLLPFRLDAALTERFRRARSVTLRLFDLEAQPIDIELSLIGFSAAHAQMTRA